jgi:hypothetical protein
MLKSKTILVMSALATAIALSACQPKQTDKKEEQAQSEAQVETHALKLVGDTEELALNLPDCKGKSCPDLEIERLSSNQTFIDNVIDAQILKILKETLTLAPAQEKEMQASIAQESSSAVETVQQTPKQKLEKQVEPFTKAFLSLDEEIKALSANHQISMMIKPKILSSSEPLATVVLNSSNYLGGAHGSSSQEYFNFDLETKKQVQLSDIVEPNKLKDLEAKSYEAFKAWVIESELSTDLKEYEQVWKFKLASNFNLGKNGLILQYGEYEIGPYVVGLPRLTIPYDQLNGILKAKYLPEVATKPASEVTTSDKEKK